MWACRKEAVPDPFVGVPVEIKFHRIPQDAAAGKLPMPFQRCIGFAHSAQIRQQPEGIGIGHGDAVAIDHRQGKAGALQQGAGVPQIGEWGNARACAAR